MRARFPIATTTWYHVMSFDITQCHDRTTALSQNCPRSMIAAGIRGASKLVLKELPEVRSNKCSLLDPVGPTSDGKVVYGRLIALAGVVD